MEWNITSEVSNQDLKSFFGSLKWGDLWADAQMVQVLAYARGSKHLHLGEWRPFFPKEIKQILVAPHACVLQSCTHVGDVIQNCFVKQK